MNETLRLYMSGLRASSLVLRDGLGGIVAIDVTSCCEVTDDRAIGQVVVIDVDVCARGELPRVMPE